MLQTFINCNKDQLSCLMSSIISLRQAILHHTLLPSDSKIYQKKLKSAKHLIKPFEVILMKIQLKLKLFIVDWHYK